MLNFIVKMRYRIDSLYLTNKILPWEYTGLSRLEV